MRIETTPRGLVKAYDLTYAEAVAFIEEDPNALYVVQYTMDHPMWYSLFAGLKTLPGFEMLGFIQLGDTFTSITRW